MFKARIHENPAATHHVLHKALELYALNSEQCPFLRNSNSELSRAFRHAPFMKNAYRRELIVVQRDAGVCAQSVI
ncbi:MULTISPECIES: hypothetical protein [Caballeronia]|uniref:Uncharacterized protein n=1 Tax=Caballeronia jiangsuensis TaxID=1458357 RepID=A0ABW9CIV0_9BURK|nr:hypothetical protein [Caballeronia sp. GaOx3]